jgi:8-oxo-dGTP pyrophosphatase MutT (NUDIX family)
MRLFKRSAQYSCELNQPTERRTMAQPVPSQERLAPPPTFHFEVDGGLTEWNVPAKEWLTRNRENIRERQLKLDGLATGNIVFNPEGRVLIIQRASNDSMPNRWEIPGGAVDDEDPTILYGAAREMWEESGLVAKRFSHLVTEGPEGRDLQVFPNSKETRWFCRFTFDVEVESYSYVRLDPTEHQDFAWASEEEIRAQKIGNRELPITNKAMLSLILESFRLKKEMNRS